MPITPFAILLIAIYVYILVVKKNLKLIFRSFVIVLLIVTLNIRMGYFFKIGDGMMAYRAVATYITAIISMVLIYNQGKAKKNMLIASMLFIGALGVNYFIAKFFTYRGPILIINWADYVLGERSYGYLTGSELEIGIYLVFICNCFILMAAKKIFNKNDITYIISRTIDFSLFSILIGYFEWIFTNVFKSTFITDAAILIFGKQGAQLDLLTQRGFLFTIQGFTKEPSMFATVIFYLSILIVVESLLDKSKNEKRKKWLISCFVLLAINPTLSSYLYIVIALIIIFIINPSGIKRLYTFRSILRTLIICMFSFFLFFFCASNANVWQTSSNYLLQRLGNAFVQFNNIMSESNLLYSSEAIRLSSIVYDFKMWLERPLFGYGIGSLACISGIVTFLAGGGLICLVLYIYVLISFARISKEYIANITIFIIGIFIVPSLLQNEYETIMCMVIPFASYGYSLSVLDRQKLTNK